MSMKPMAGICIAMCTGSHNFQRVAFTTVDESQSLFQSSYGYLAADYFSKNACLFYEGDLYCGFLVLKVFKLQNVSGDSVDLSLNC